MRWLLLPHIVFFFLGMASGQQASQPTAWTNPAVLPLDQIAPLWIPPIDRVAVAQEDEQQRLRGLAPRIFIPVAVHVTPATGGTWENLDEKLMLWRLRITAPGADHLNLGFTRFFLPHGARLIVYAADRSEWIRPFTEKDNKKHLQLWTPVVRAEEIVAELTIPRSVLNRCWIELTQVGYGYRGFGAKSQNSSTLKSGACNIDVVCQKGDPWRSQIPGVGLIHTGSGFCCSGSMINNTANDRRPLFLTANHCGITAANAPSLVVYWNYETSTCGGTPNGQLNNFQTGSTLRSHYPPSDFSLVELSSRPNLSWGVTYAGWDRRAAGASRAVTIHHPACDEKRISFEDQPTQTTSYFGTQSPGNGTHVRIIDWDFGTTEHGSSGAPLFNQDHRIIGQLHGGAAACGNNLSDWFGRLYVSWNGGGTPSTRLSNWLDPGNTGATTTDTIMSAPNDECSGAQQIANGANTSLSNAGASDSSQPWPCGGSSSSDVWFVYTASCTGTLTVDTCSAGTNFDTKIEALVGTCGSLTSLGCNDDSCGLQSSLDFSTIAGNTYYVRVGGYRGAQGRFDLNVTCVPTPVPNDECYGAFGVSNGLNGPFSNVNATDSLPPWHCGGSLSSDVWFVYTASCTGSLTVDTCTSTSFDTKIEVLQGASCGGLLAFRGCNDDSCGLQSSLTFSTTAGYNYFIRVGGFNGVQGTFHLNIECVLANDECTAAIAVSNGSNGSFDNYGATDSPETWPCGGLPSSDVWFIYTASCTGTLTASTCDPLTDFDTKIEILGGTCGSLTSLGCNDDSCGLQSSLSVSVFAGITYYLRVGGYYGRQGTFVLNVACSGYNNDECMGAVPLNIGANGLFTNTGATNSPEVFPCGFQAGPDVWFSFASPTCGQVVINTCSANTTFDTVLEVFGGACGALNPIACNDDACGLQSEVSFFAASGGTYYLHVGGYGGATGFFGLNVFIGGGGSFAMNPTGCGTVQIYANGLPATGGIVNFGMTGVVGIPYMWIGLNLLNIPLCAGCTVGVDFAATYQSAALSNVLIPCDPNLVGASLAVQGADFGGGGGCTSPTVALTDTVVINIG